MDVPQHDTVVNGTQAMAYLGLASTEDLIQELISRLSVGPLISSGDVGNYAAIKRGLSLAELLGSLSPIEREYRTVDS